MVFPDLQSNNINPYIYKMRIPALLLSILFLISCNGDEADRPEMKTLPAGEVGLSRAVLRGLVKEVGPLKPVDYGFLMSTTGGVNVLNAKNKWVVGATSEKDTDFSIEVNELTANTTYFVRSFASDPSFSSITYGNEVSFKTTQPSQYIRTLPAESIANTSVLLKGEVLSLNEQSSVTYGFAYATSPFTSLLDAQVKTVGTTTVALTYQSTIPSLTPLTTYYFRAFISNAAGTLIVYGDQLSFTTTN